MATHRSIPGANLPETGATGRKGRSSGEAGATSLPTTGTTSSAIPGESGLGAGLGDSSSVDERVSGRESAARAYPRAVGVMNQVKQSASSRVNEQKARAAEGLGSVANAIKQASEHLRSENQTLAAYADTAVDQMQLFADRMRDKDPAEMVRDAERFARRNPGAFVGGAFLLGLGLARFLKSSSAQAFDDRAYRHEDSPFGEPTAGTTPVPARTGFTSPGADIPRAGDIGRAPGSLSIDPAPGLTS